MKNKAKKQQQKLFKNAIKKRVEGNQGVEKEIKPIPTISEDYYTDYEFDEYDNYKKYYIFQAIVYSFWYIIYKIFKCFVKKNDENLVKCEICFEQYPNNRLICCSSNHQVCGLCFRETVKNHVFPISLEKLNKGFPCPSYKCQQYINYDICAKFIPRKTRDHIQKKIYAAVLNSKTLQYQNCKNCGTISAIKNNRIFCCSTCSYRFCYYCVKECKPSHTVQECIIKEKNIISDILTEALIHRCHGCKMPFLKQEESEACNYIQCKCGASQCYACREIVFGFHSCYGIGLKARQIHETDISNAKRRLEAVKKFG